MIPELDLRTRETGSWEVEKLYEVRHSDEWPRDMRSRQLWLRLRFKAEAWCRWERLGCPSLTI